MISKPVFGPVVTAPGEYYERDAVRRKLSSCSQIPTGRSQSPSGVEEEWLPEECLQFPSP